MTENLMAGADALASTPMPRSCVSQLLNLTKLTIFAKFATMDSPQQPTPAVITPPFEVHTMTAEAPSPPNPMQSLRERLIQEGFIIPESSIEKLKDKLNKKVLPIIAASIDMQDEMRKSYLNYAISVIAGRAIDSLSKYECESFGEKLRYIWTLRFSLLINKLDKFINFSFPMLISNGQSTPFARCGFYSPLKENMKNVP